MSKLKAAETLLALERDYQERKRKIRADTSLSFEKKELAIRRLGQRFDADRKRIERGGTA
jgi:hypothetical protein